jgi:hypothetical protein
MVEEVMKRVARRSSRRCHGEGEGQFQRFEEFDVSVLENLIIFETP